MQFFSLFVWLLRTDLYIFHKTFVLNTPSIFSSAFLNAHVSEPYREIGRNYVIDILIFTFFERVLDFSILFSNL